MIRFKIEKREQKKLRGNELRFIAINWYKAEKLVTCLALSDKQRYKADDYYTITFRLKNKKISISSEKKFETLLNSYEFKREEFLNILYKEIKTFIEKEGFTPFDEEVKSYIEKYSITGNQLVELKNILK